MAITGIKYTNVAHGDGIDKEEVSKVLLEGVLEGYATTDVVNASDIKINITPELDKDGAPVSSKSVTNLVVNSDGTFTAEVDLSDLDAELDGILWVEAEYNGLKSAEKTSTLLDRVYDAIIVNNSDGTTEESTDVVSGNVIDMNGNGIVESNHGDDTAPTNIAQNGDKQNAVSDTLTVLVPSVHTSAVNPMGTLTMNSNGDYTYTLDNAKAQSLSKDEVNDEIYTFEVMDHVGNKKTEHLVISIVGENDAACVKDVQLAGLEGDAAVGGTTDGKVDVDEGVATVYKGKLSVTDIDTHDGHEFSQVGATVVESACVDKTLLTDVNLTLDADGQIQLDGNFDALAEGETATVTFQYQTNEFYDKNGNGVLDGSEVESGKSNIATATITVTGTNDALNANDDQIYTFRDLPTGNIYEAILRNDTDLDVNDKKYIYQTTQPLNGSHASVELSTSGEYLQYTPAHKENYQGDNSYNDTFIYNVSDRADHGDLSASNSQANVHIDILSANMNESIENYVDSSCGCGDNEFCGTEKDDANGKTGNDLIAAGSGNDSVCGFSGNDLLYGGAGQDTVKGGKGDDVLYGGKDSDTLYGGEGNDLFAFNKGDGADTVKDFETNDEIFLGTTITAKDIAFFLDDNGTAADTTDDKLMIKYTKECNDVVTVNGAGLDSASVVYDTTAGGVVHIDVAAVIDAINTYNTTDGNTAVTNVCEVQNNDELMTIIANAGGYAAA